MEGLARKIWGSNLKYRGKVVIAIEALLGWCGLASTLFTMEDAIQYELFLNGIYLLLVILSCEQWISRYLYLDNGKVGMGGEVQSLLEIMRYHAFDVEAYFAVIRKSLWKLEIFHVLFWLLRCLGFAENILTWQKAVPALVSLFVAILCPYLLCWLKKKYYAYYLCHRREIAGSCLKVFGTIVRFLGEYVEIAAVLVGGVLLSMLLGAFFSEIFTVSPIGEEFIWRRSYYTIFSTFIGLVLMLLVVLWAAGGYVLVKRKGTAVMICSVVFVLMLGLSAVETNRYIDFYDGRIVVRNLWKEKEYRQKDIARYCVGAEEGGIQLRLFMQNGETIKVVTASFENSDLYEEKYFGDYTYIADYVKELGEQGIDGELQDLQELREDVEKLNKEEQQGLERIVREIEGD